MNFSPIYLFVSGIGFTEILLVAVVVFIVFGAKRLPEIMRSVGKALNEFKKVTSDLQNEALKEMERTESLGNEDDKSRK